MSIVELIDKYDGLGVRFWLDDGQLRFRAPSGALNDRRMAELRDHKEDLIAYLGTSEETVATHDPSNRYAPFPLTPIQGAYLVGRGSGFEFGNVGCHGYVELSLPRLEKDRLEAAWHTLIKRHDMLRAVVLENGYQQVLPEVPLPPVNELDLCGVPADRITSGIETIRKELSNKQYAPDEWPLFDLSLTTLDRRSILHFSIDMLIGDFISIDILLGELDHLYHQGTPLPQLDITFRDVVLFERAMQEGPLMVSRKERDRQYWLSRIDKLPGAPELPMASNIGKNEPASFERHVFKLDREKWDFFCKFARHQKITPSCAVLSAFSETIGRWSKQPAFCLNITVLLRPEIHPQIDKIVGDYTSVSVLEVSMDINTTFLHRTQRLQERLWQDMEHRTFTGIDVLREMGRRNGKRIIIPIVFTSMLGLETQKRESGEYMSEARLDYGISQTPQVLIDCQVSEHNGGLHLNWDVRNGIFPEGMIEDAFGAFSHLLSEMSREEDVWRTAVPLRLPDHTLAVRTEVNNICETFPDTLLHDGFYHSLQTTPDALSLISGDSSYTYRELGCHAAAVQQALVKEGCTYGDIAAVVLEKGVWQVAAVLGTLFAGGTYLPIDTAEPGDRLNTILKDSGTRFVLSASEPATRNWPSHVRVINVYSLAVEPQLPELKKIYPEQLAYIIYTSGSTGKPKGVMMNHRAAQNTILDINKRFNVTNRDRVLCLANLNFDLSVYDIFGVLAVGGTLVVPDPEKRKDPSHWFDLIQTHEITLWNSVPVQMHMLLTYLDSSDEATRGNTSLRLAMLSGDWIPPRLPERLYRHYPKISVISLGGATEAGIWSIFYDIKQVQEGATSIPYGIPLGNQQIHILNAHMQPCPDWTAGDIYIGGKSLASGYLNNPERTREHFIIHPDTKAPIYKTGDLGRYRTDGVVEFLGREDTQVKIRGFRIELGEIEKAAQSHPDISLAVAMITGDEPLDRQLAIFAEANLLVRTKEAVKKISDLKKILRQAGREVTSKIDRPMLEKWITLSDKAALVNMIRTFHHSGLFTAIADTHSVGDIVYALKVKPEYNSLINRWLNALCTGNILERVNGGSIYRMMTQPFKQEATVECWRELEEVEDKIHFSEEFMHFLQLSGDHLSGLLCGQVDPIELFFPGGSLDTALAAYSNNFVNRSLNWILAQGLVTVARAHQIHSERSLRILEIGAGTGGTTMALLPSLADFKVEYMFTDVSQFFINEAQKRFENYPWVSYGLYDLNRDYWEQDMSAGSWDVIICANVIHNSQNVPAVLSALKELAVPGGYLCIIEGTTEPVAWLTSLEFIFKKQGIRFSDDRAENEMAFFSHDKWVSMLSDLQADIICAYPAKDELFTVAGQTAFIAQFPLERVSVTSERLKDHLESKLPRYMVPSYIEILPGIPLSPNGKIDRANLKKRVGSIKKNDSQGGDPPRSGLERQIADIWCTVLNRNDIRRDDDFFTIGGDSLLVAQVIARMREHLPEAGQVKWDILMRDMLQHPTVAAVAEKFYFQTRSPETEPPADASPVKAGFSFAVLAEGQPDAKTIRVIFHTGNGNLASYRHLLPHLINDPDRKGSIAGIAVADADYLEAIPSNRLIEELGRRYAASILRHRDSRIELIGYCSGGLIVLETARNLLESGVNLAPITIIDTATFSCQVEDELLLERLFAQQLGATLEKTGHFVDEELLASAVIDFLDTRATRIPHNFLTALNGEFSAIANCYCRLAEISQARRLSDIVAAMPDSGENPVSDFQAGVLKILYRIFRQTFQGIAAYGPAPFAGDVRLFRAEDQALQAIPGVAPNTIEFWDDLTLGNLEIIKIPGNHLSCMQPPYVTAVANFLTLRENQECPL